MCETKTWKKRKCFFSNISPGHRPKAICRVRRQKKNENIENRIREQVSANNKCVIVSNEVMIIFGSTQDIEAYGTHTSIQFKLPFLQLRETGLSTTLASKQANYWNVATLSRCAYSTLLVLVDLVLTLKLFIFIFSSTINYMLAAI